MEALVLQFKNTETLSKEEDKTNLSWACQPLEAAHYICQLHRRHYKVIIGLQLEAQSLQ